MARRPAPPDPELTALARDRLARLLGGTTDRPRRAARLLPGEDEEDGVVRGGRGAAWPGVREAEPPAVGLDDLEVPRRFTRWHLGVVAAVLLVGLVWGGWSWVRSRPEAVAAPTVQSSAGPGVPTAPAQPVPGQPSSGTAPGGAAGGASASADPSASGLVVHVLGAVRHPGLVRLPAGARVQDAIKAAGGLRDDADPAQLNLAQPLEDGVQVVVGTRRHPLGEVRAVGAAAGGGGSGGGSTGGSASTAGSGAVVDLNRASVDQLDTLPGVGPVTAQKIVDWREQHGRFSAADELQEVDGIGPKTYARLAPHVRV
ncbi:hypothetical protein GCM10022197_40510 [Microlunatus spumicola]|uniref:Helix-hairpin-helix DNA-binding motif class 1 domain-containing protein n=1 Tax=Microlunatus spumicola TaxID=81499 RepID=A0ABP6YAI7_9ACTN